MEKEVVSSDPYSILLKNPTRNEKTRIPDYVVEYLNGKDSNQLNKVSNDKVRLALEWISDPINYREYRDYVMFKSTANKVY